ncbi:MAG: hypothetical protein DRJ14_06565 [Acidobacteria bacterium]|nr:MAG: hypothetical protein DRJ14_06565 [Acidobacteriota bacterium]
MNKLDIELIRKKLKTTVMIWFSFIVSILLYAGVVEWMERRGGEIIVTENRSLHLIFLAVAAICFLAAGIVKNILLKIPLEKADQDIETLAERLVNASIVSLAFSEAICLLGLAEYFISRNYDSFYVFFIVGLLGIVIHMPRYPKWKSYLEQMTGITLPEEGLE